MTRTTIGLCIEALLFIACVVMVVTLVVYEPIKTVACGFVTDAKGNIVEFRR